MRSLLAFILGIVVTVGAAFVHDNMLSGTKRLVDWDGVHATVGSFAAMVHDQFAKK